MLLDIIACMIGYLIAVLIIRVIDIIIQHFKQAPNTQKRDKGE